MPGPVQVVLAVYVVYVPRDTSCGGHDERTRLYLQQTIKEKDISNCNRIRIWDLTSFPERQDTIGFIKSHRLSKIRVESDGAVGIICKKRQKKRPYFVVSAAHKLRARLPQGMIRKSGLRPPRPNTKMDSKYTPTNLPDIPFWSRNLAQAGEDCVWLHEKLDCKKMGWKWWPGKCTSCLCVVRNLPCKY
jgi:hypothetical protein